MRRLSKLTIEVREEICAHIREGLSYADACLLAGVHRSTFHRWRQWGEQAKRGFLIVVFALGGVVVGQDLVQGRTLRVGTGSVSGVYFPVGEIAAKVIGDADSTLRVTAVATDGSVHNRPLAKVKTGPTRS